MKSLDSVDLADIRDKALILVGFYSFCRRSEVLNLHYKDLNISEESIILTILTPRQINLARAEGCTAN